VTHSSPLAHHCLLRENIIRMHGAVMYDRKKLSEIGGFDAALAYCEDYEIYLRMSLHHRIASHTKVAASYRLHGQNMSRDTVAMRDWSVKILDRYCPPNDDHWAMAAWKAGKKALPKAFANLAWKDRGASARQRLIERGRWIRLAPRSSVMAAIRQLIARAVPGPVLDRVRRMRQRMTSADMGAIDFGDLARLDPVDRGFGFARGTPIDRHYIENFLAREAAAIKGRVLEIGDASYSRQFGANITHQDVLNCVPGHPSTTIVGDLSQADVLVPGSFDCIIITQTLQYIYDIKSAIAELRKGLRDGGTVLATAPGLSPIPGDEGDWFWLLTGQSAARLFADEFGAENVKIEVAGNAFAATCFFTRDRS